MESDVIVLDNYFDATLEQVTNVIDDYLGNLVKLVPNVALVVEVNVPDSSRKKIWNGKIIEATEWGIPDISYGYIEIIPAFVNRDTPMKVRLYCSHPNYITYWAGLGKTLRDRLKESDGSPGLSNQPWILIDDTGNDREIIRLWHAGRSVQAIANHFGYSPKTINNRISFLRKTNGEVIVPLRIPQRKRKKIGQ